LQSQVPDAFPVLHQRPVVDVARVLFLDEHQRLPVHEPADVVNVPMRVVARRTFAQPEYVLDTEILPEGLLVLSARQTGIADLNLRMKITFFGRQQRAAAVYFDYASFQHKGLAVAFGVEEAFPQAARGHFRHPAILLPVVMPRPRVEVEMDDGRVGVRCSMFDVRCFPLYKYRPAVAHPAAVGRMRDEPDALQ